MAETIDVEFEYKGFAANSLTDLNASMSEAREGKTAAVNSIFDLHQLMAGPGDVEKILQVVRDLKPTVFTGVEREVNYNGAVFFEPFIESLF